MYRYNSKKDFRSVHIVDDKTGRTFCKAENGCAAKSLDTDSEELPPNRPECTMCSAAESRISAGGERRESKSNLKAFYQSWEWSKARFETLKRYGAKCMCCGATERIVVDHIKSRRMYPDLELDLENMQVLCDICNRGKSYDDSTDFRPQAHQAPEAVQ